jgi:hypothetical protein
MADGQGDDLVRDPKRSFPSFISAATFLDIANTPAEFKDFFGVQTPNPAVTRIHCPLLGFFGTKGDVHRQASGPSRVNTIMIQNADHMYAGQEAQVAQTIAKWADTLALSESGTETVPGKQ